MVAHICNTCKRVFSRKSTYTDHCSKKKPCKPTELDDKLDITPHPGDPDLHPGDPDPHLSDPEFHPNDPEFHPNDPIIAPKYEKEICCPYCCYIFTTNSNMQRHILKCKYKTQSDDDDDSNEVDGGVKPLKPRDIIVRRNDHSCHYCGRIFSKNSGLHRHIRICQTKKQLDEGNNEPNNPDIVTKIKNRLKQTDVVDATIIDKVVDEEVVNDIMKMLQDDVTQLVTQTLTQTGDKNTAIAGDNNTLNTTNNTTNNTINNTLNGNINVNNTVNIKLVSFNDEDLYKIDDKTIMKAIDKGFLAVQTFVKDTHFSDKYPELQNIYIPSEKSTNAVAFRNGQWVLVDQKYALKELYDNNRDFLEDQFVLLKDKLSGQTTVKFNRFISTHDKNEAIGIDIQKELRRILYNNRDMIKKSRDRQQLQAKIDDLKLYHENAAKLQKLYAVVDELKKEEDDDTDEKLIPIQAQIADLQQAQYKVMEIYHLRSKVDELQDMVGLNQAK